MCDRKNDVVVKELRKLKLTVLSENLCAKLGNIEEKNVKRITVNTKMELCASFVGKRLT